MTVSEPSIPQRLWCSYPDCHCERENEGKCEAKAAFESEPACCKEHGTELMWANCGNCNEGFTHHDCGEDCCCCLYPEDNVRCDICNGKGGWMLCPVCSPNAKF